MYYIMYYVYVYAYVFVFYVTLMYVPIALMSLLVFAGG